MRIFLNTVKFEIPIIAIYLFCIAAWSSPSFADVSSVNFEQAKSLPEIRNALTLLEASFTGIKEKNISAFDLQKMVAVKSGECVTRLVELSQKADLSQDAQREEYKTLFLKNGELLKHMLAYNQSRMDDFLEEKQAGAQDKNAFLTSPEWQQAQYLTSLANYWLGWNNYYGGLLYADQYGDRATLLEEAISGFTLASINFQEQSIVTRSILGRGLCFKELKRYDKALEDLQTVMGKVSRDDPMYSQAGYEKAMIRIQSGKKDLALKELQELQQNVKPGAMPQQVREKIKSLQTSIALGVAEKKQSGQGSTAKESYRDAAAELKRIADADESQAAVLYQYVLEHAAALETAPDAELGSMGVMAIADWYFERKQYEPAIERYRWLYGSPDNLIKPHMDDVCFRLAYALAQKQQWLEALSCLETLFQKYPKSSFGGKAACLYYVTAVRAYKENSSEAVYSRYIKAAECYVKNCPDAQDKSEAHFQLGQYYQQKNRTQEALHEFSLVKNDSPHYNEAQRAGLQSTVDTLQETVEKIESLLRQGQSDEARRLYRAALNDSENRQKTAQAQKDAGTRGDSAAHITFLLARLYLHGPEPAPQKALPLLQGFETKYPVTRQADLLYGMVKKLRLECYIQLLMPTEAERELSGIIGKGPVDRNTLAFLKDCGDRTYKRIQDTRAGAGDTSLLKKEAQTALVVYGKLSEISLQDASCKDFYEPLQMRMGELYTMADQTAKARAIYEQKLVRDPTSGDAMNQLGLIYEKEENWNAAIDVWTKFAKGLKPGSHPWFDARYRTALAFVKLDKKKEACEVLSMTQSLHPEISADALNDDYKQLQETTCRK